VDANTNLAFQSSPAAMVANLTAPLLLIHGDSDRNVAVQETIGLVRLLDALGRNKQVETLFFANEIHGLSLFSNQVLAASATASFLLQGLAGAQHK
jgi:dipeptidyl aminopeptidase/acylaminoacyl peptidase